MELLSASAVIELAKVQQSLLLEPRVSVKKSPWLKATQRWCEEHEIELGDNESRQFWITRSGIAAIERWLSLHQQGSLQQQVRSRQGQRDEVSSSNEKIAQISPMEHQVLCANCDLGQRLNQQQFFSLTETPPQINVELDYSVIELEHYDYLVVIENRDSFNDWFRYLPQTIGLSRALVIYRGHDKAHSKGCKGLKSLWKEAKGEQGLVYFGDADIAGLGIAMAGETPYQHLLLPSLSDLNARLDALQANPHYDYSQRNLENQLLKRWLPLYKVLNQQAALRQQNMFDIPLELY